MVVNPYKTVATEQSVQCHQPLFSRRWISRTAIVVFLLLITVVSYWFHIHHSLQIADNVQEGSNLRGKLEDNDAAKVPYHRGPIKKVDSNNSNEKETRNNFETTDTNNRKEIDNISDEPENPITQQANNNLPQNIIEQTKQHIRKVAIDIPSTKQPTKPADFQIYNLSSSHSEHITLKPIKLSFSRHHNEHEHSTTPVRSSSEHVTTEKTNITLSSTAEHPSDQVDSTIQHHVLDVETVIKKHQEAVENSTAALLSDHNKHAMEAYLHLVKNNTSTSISTSKPTINSDNTVNTDKVAPQNTEKVIAPGTSVTTSTATETTDRTENTAGQQQQPPVVIPHIPPTTASEVLKQLTANKPHLNHAENPSQSAATNEAETKMPKFVPLALTGGDYIPPRLQLPELPSQPSQPSQAIDGVKSNTGSQNEASTSTDKEDLTPVATYNPPRDPKKKYDLAPDVVEKLKLKLQQQRQPQSISALLQKTSSGEKESVREVGDVDNNASEVQQQQAEEPLKTKPVSISTSKNVASDNQKKIDYCANQIDPYDHVPVESFKPPPKAPFESSLKYNTAVKQMKKTVSRVTVGGDALRQQLVQEVNKLKVLRFELFCMFPPS